MLNACHVTSILHVEFSESSPVCVNHLAVKKWLIFIVGQDRLEHCIMGKSVISYILHILTNIIDYASILIFAYRKFTYCTLYTYCILQEQYYLNNVGQQYAKGIEMAFFLLSTQWSHGLQFTCIHFPQAVQCSRMVEVFQNLHYCELTSSLILN